MEESLLPCLRESTMHLQYYALTDRNIYIIKNVLFRRAAQEKCELLQSKQSIKRG